MARDTLGHDQSVDQASAGSLREPTPRSEPLPMTGRSELADLEPISPTMESARAAARKRVEKRRNLQGGLVAYVVINAFLVAVWAMTGAGYFWPAWIIAGWGVGMLLGLWDYLRGPVTDSDVDDELRRMQR